MILPKSCSCHPTLLRLSNVQLKKRVISSSIHRLNEQVPAEEAGQQKLTSRTRLPKKFIVEQEGSEWLNGEGKRYDLLARRNWLHPKRPFPKNPWFVPPSPVGDGKREEIYNEYISDPVKWTPRQLAIKYELSIVRIEAILKLKHLEKQQSQHGYVLQKQFATQMEDLLGCGTEPGIEESVDNSISANKTPYPAFIVRESGTEPDCGNEPVVTADSPVQEESTNEEQLEITKDKFKRRPDGNYIMALPGVIQEPEPEVCILESQNPRETNERFRFIIADLSEGKDEESAQVLVRDNDGTLRTATLAERRMHFQLYPKSPQTTDK